MDHVSTHFGWLQIEWNHPEREKNTSHGEIVMVHYPTFSVLSYSSVKLMDAWMVIKEKLLVPGLFRWNHTVDCVSLFFSCSKFGNPVWLDFFLIVQQQWSNFHPKLISVTCYRVDITVRCHTDLIKLDDINKAKFRTE